jgi:hypothetical protein
MEPLVNEVATWAYIMPVVVFLFVVVLYFTLGPPRRKDDQDD